MNVIFHVPKAVDPRALAGFHVRVPKMIQGFRDAGCMVHVIAGDAKARRPLIRSLARRIRAGDRFDFMYAENATVPSLLVEGHHFPRHPFLDFNFFGLCREYGIPIGLFYRDIYWRMKEFSRKMPVVSRALMTIFHYIDLSAYRRYCMRIFLPSIKMGAHMPMIPPDRFRALPPGIEARRHSPARIGLSLRIFYVGGIGPFYNLEALFRVVHRLPFVTLTVCCRPQDWVKSKSVYRPYLSDRIRIVHASGGDLEPLFNDSDIGSLFLKPQQWRDFAMPIKLFEYLEYGLPVIGTPGTAAADFISQNGTGWVIDYSEEALADLLSSLQSNRDRLATMRARLVAAALHHTWRARAELVMRELTVTPSGGSQATGVPTQI